MECRIAGYIRHSLVNGPGVRMVIFFQGCPHHCKGCHNPETWDIDGGKIMDTSEIINLINSTRHIDGITLSGGDPLLQSDAVIEIARAAKDIELSVWCYTGWTMETILAGETSVNLKVMDYIDVLVDGPFVVSLKEDGLPYRGSSNQRILRVKHENSL